MSLQLAFDEFLEHLLSPGGAAPLDENEIARLNPSYRPEYQVPAGTILQLPGDAKSTP